ncbi:MAG: hypothetical protein HQM03_18635 [Magnetococcales bacterium]|nr:hypothetical protein [Magnetococcales bacterium]
MSDSDAGSALLVTLNLLVMALASLLLAGLSAGHGQWRREMDEARLLAVANEALIAYREYTGRLPEPEAGRLPCRELAIPPLRDAAGRELRYVVTRGAAEVRLADGPGRVVIPAAGEGP